MEHQKQRIHELTGLRLIAAAWVFLSHLGYVITYPPGIRRLLGDGTSGVSLFFILSGFVLYHTYEAQFRENVSPQAFLRFMRARVARLYPTYVMALLVAAACVLFFLKLDFPLVQSSVATPLTAQTLALSWIASVFAVQIYLPDLGLQNLWDGPSWSIADEIFFYIVCPFFIAYGLRHFRRAWPLVLLALSLFALEVAALLISVGVIAASSSVQAGFHWVDQFGYRLPFMRVWEFFLGCTLGAIYRKMTLARGGSISHAPHASAKRNVVLVSAIMGVVCLALAPHASGFVADAFPAFLRYVLDTPLFAAIILCLAFGRTILSRVLQHPMVQLLGESSYALYILHFIPISALMYFAQMGTNLGTITPGVVALLTVLLSVVVYARVEVPARRALAGRPTAAGQLAITRAHPTLSLRQSS